MRVDRRGLSDQLKEFALDGSGLVVGAPGSGKSYHLRELADSLLKSQRQVLFLPIDRLLARDSESLAAELGVNSIAELTSDLARSPEGGVCIIDAFDAARSSDIRSLWLQTIRILKRDLGPLWRVIVSVRSYDARKSIDLLEMFPADSHPVGSLTDPSIEARHLMIPLLTVEERKSALASLAEHQEPPQITNQLLDLLDTPFKLWLLERVLEGGATSAELSGIISELPLLDLFWKQRVASEPQSEAKQLLLRSIALDMVVRSTLTVPSPSNLEQPAVDALAQLLSSEVISAPGPYLSHLTFAHNILFDYAVATLVVPADEGEHVSFLGEDPGRPLFLRPSLSYFYASIWHADRPRFWLLLRALQQVSSETVRLFGRLLPFATVAAEARILEDLDPLLGTKFSASERAQYVTWTLQALRSFGVTETTLWALAARELAHSPDRDFVWDLALLLRDLRSTEALDSDEEALCGDASRALLNWVWGRRKKDPSVDSLGAHHLVPLVAQTFSSNPQESRAVLLPIFDLLKEDGFPIEYFFRLSLDASALLHQDESLLEQLYESAFSHQEVSDAPTPMGGPILPLISNRRQDFESCRYTLTEFFPRFISASHRVGFRTGLKATNAYVMERHVLLYLRKSKESPPALFSFAGSSAKLIEDGSYIWASDIAHENELSIAAESLRLLEQASDDQELLEALLREFGTYAEVAFLWRGLLDLIARHPDRFVNYASDLFRALPVLNSHDLLVALGAALEACFHLLDEDARREIEDLVMASTPSSEDKVAQEADERLRNRLVARMPASALVTPAARELRTQLAEHGKLPTNEPLIQFEDFTARSYTTKDWLADQGVDPATEEHRTILDKSAPLEEFSTFWQNQVPSAESASSIIPTIGETRALLRKDLDPPLLRTAWTRLAAAAKTAARAISLISSHDLSVLKEILLDASEREVESEVDSEFTHPAWSPSPQTEAAQGLPWIAIRDPSPEVLQAITKLSRARSPSVRYLVGSEFWRLKSSATEAAWLLIEQRVAEESVPSIQRTLCFSLWRLMGDDLDRGVRALRVLSEENRPPGNSDAWESIFSLAFVLAFRHQNPWAKNLLEQVLAEGEPEVLRTAIIEGLEYLRPEAVNRADGTLGLACTWLHAAIESLSRFLAEAEIPINEGSPAHTAYRVLDDFAMRLDLTVDRPNKARPELERGMLSNFVREVKPIVDALLDLAPSFPQGILPASVVHHLVQFLAAVLPEDPPWVLRSTRRAASIGKGGGYTLDNMAIREVVDLVEHVLADYPKVLRGDALTDLVGLLDIFAEVGWPDAIKLIWRLDEVYR